jgi:hypothetical protein
MNVFLAAVAGISALAAVLSWLASRSSARAAETTANLDKERRHDEIAPNFSARFGLANWSESTTKVGGVDVVWFDYMDGPGTLSNVIVTLVNRSEAQRPPLIAIRDSASEPALQDDDSGPWGQQLDHLYPFDLEVGREPLTMVKRHPEQRAGTAVFVLTCERGDEEWTVAVRREIPKPLANPSVVNLGDFG